MTLDPYGLLGVTHRSTVSEVRRAYYKLARMCHPDAGGQADDMCTVQAAYQYVLAQISQVKSDDSLEARQQAFDDFLQKQASAAPPRLADIHHELFGKRNDKLNGMWQNSTIPKSHSCYQGGYGDRMSASEYGANPTAEPHYQSAVEQPSDAPSFPQQVVLYKAVDGMPARSSAAPAPVVLNDPDDYSATDAGLSMCDYATAMSDPAPTDVVPDRDLTDAALEALQADRLAALRVQPAAQAVVSLLADDVQQLRLAGRESPGCTP